MGMGIVGGGAHDAPIRTHDTRNGTHNAPGERGGVHGTPKWAREGYGGNGTSRRRPLRWGSHMVRWGVRDAPSGPWRYPGKRGPHRADGNRHLRYHKCHHDASMKKCDRRGRRLDAPDCTVRYMEIETARGALNALNEPGRNTGEMGRRGAVPYGGDRTWCDGASVTPQVGHGGIRGKGGRTGRMGIGTSDTTNATTTHP